MSSAEATVLQSWEACIETVGDHSVELLMADATIDRGSEREIGTFPTHLFEHLSPPPVPGRILTVDVMSDRTIRMSDVVITDARR